MKSYLLDIYFKIKLKYYQSLMSIKLYYVSFLDFIDDELGKNNKVYFKDLTVIQKQKENTKLTLGVRKMVKRLRAMSVSERLSTENLLSKESYKKTLVEKIEELRAVDKVRKNPLLRTEDNLVNKVVKEAPRYSKQQKLREVQKSMRAVLKAAESDPSNPKHTSDMKALKAESEALKRDINRMKQSV